MSEECPKCPPEGLPAYMGTFADLMALLMCFFVLLLSFAEMDVLKFKQIAGSMNMAFGVQNKVRVRDIPKGTSIIAQEFSPGKPQPTVIEAVMQETIDVTKETVEFNEAEESSTEDNQGEGESADNGDGEQSQVGATPEEAQQLAQLAAQAEAEAEAKAQAEAEALAMAIASQLQDELNDGLVELRAKGTYVMIRIREKGSFASASDTLEEEFIPVINKIETILSNTKGEIRVAGHTDNLPIDNEYFRSNWELSGGRAGSVTRELLSSGLLDRNRFVITGYADTKPIAENNTAEGRATNRRVEIIIVQGDTSQGKIIGVEKDPVIEEPAEDDIDS
jgi:chemotaxis protein MotB